MGAVVARPSYPGYREQVVELVEQHKELVDERPVLAVYYSPDRDPGDVFLFEVYDGLHGNEVARYGNDLTEVLYGPTYGFALERGQYLHIVMTNPNELRVACRENWRLLNEVRAAIGAERYEVIHQQHGDEWLMGLLRG
jgi:hypothetical protein